MLQYINVCLYTSIFVVAERNIVALNCVALHPHGLYGGYIKTNPDQKEHHMSNWQIGQTVQAGFVTVVVKAKLLDSVYICASRCGTKLYKFIPHGGLHGIAIEGAKGLIEADKRQQAAIEARIAQIQAQRSQRSAVNAVFA